MRICNKKIRDSYEYDSSQYFIYFLVFFPSYTIVFYRGINRGFSWRRAFPMLFFGQISKVKSKEDVGELLIG